MQLPAIIVYPDGSRFLFHSPASFSCSLPVSVQRPVENDDPDAPPEFVEVEEVQTITHPPEAWTLWTPADWAAMCPGLIVRPVVDPGATAEEGKRAVRDPIEAWPVGDETATVTYSQVPLTPEEIAAALPPVPRAVTNFQARAVLLAAGLFDQVDAAIKAQPQTSAAYQAWEYANEITRSGTLVNSMAETLSLTSVQLDDLFRQAAAIEA